MKVSSVEFLNVATVTGMIFFFVLLFRRRMKHLLLSTNENVLGEVA